MQNSAVCVVSRINLLGVSSHLYFTWRSLNISYSYDSMAGLMTDCRNFILM